MRGFQSAMYGPLLFGLGTVSRVDSARLRWADGKTQLVKPAAGNQLTIRYAPTAGIVLPPLPKPYWQTADLLTITHQEDAVNDFKIQ